MLERFLIDAVYCPDFELLRSQYRIPDRGYRSDSKLDIRIGPVNGPGSKYWVTVGLKKWT